MPKKSKTAPLTKDEIKNLTGGDIAKMTPKELEELGKHIAELEKTEAEEWEKIKAAGDEFKMDQLCFKIYQEMPFLGYILSSINRKRVTDFKVIPTAAITPDNVLLYNPYFFGQLNLSQQKFVLFHEVLHKAHSHFPGADEILATRFGRKGLQTEGKFKELSKEDQVVFSRYCQVLNIAMDCSINQLIAKKFEQPENLVTLASTEAMCNPDLKPGDVGYVKLEAEKEFEYYFQKLVKSNNEDIEAPADHVQQMSGIGHEPNPDEDRDRKIYENPEDCPDGDGDGDQKKSPEEYDQEMRNIIRKGYEKQRDFEMSSGIGKGDDDSILDIIPNMEVDIKDRNIWEGLVNKAFGEVLTSDNETTLKRPSRRLKGNPFGSRRICGSKNVVVCCDTSGSIGIDTIELFFGAINRACKKYGVTVDLLLTTERVYGVYEGLKKLNTDNINVSSGGTDLTRAQKWIMENKPHKGKNEHMVVLTDGYTDWIQNTPFTTAAIYTPCHSKLPGVKESAVIEMPDRD
jgi:predicted metal-dependent peptidase